MIEFIPELLDSSLEVVALVDRDGRPVEPFGDANEDEVMKEIAESVALPYASADPTPTWARDEIQTECSRGDYRAAVEIWASAEKSHKVVVLSTKRRLIT